MDATRRRTIGLAATALVMKLEAGILKQWALPQKTAAWGLVI